MWRKSERGTSAGMSLCLCLGNFPRTPICSNRGLKLPADVRGVVRGNGGWKKDKSSRASLKAESSPLTLPKNVVRPIFGKNSATLTPTSAFAECRLCAALRMSGRRSSSALGDRARVSSKEDAELILLQDNLAFDVGHIRRRG